jgi:hypothetical protein
VTQSTSGELQAWPASGQLQELLAEKCGGYSNVRSVTTKSNNRAPLGGGHLLPVEDHEGMSVVGAAVCSVAAALEVPPAATFLP